MSREPDDDDELVATWRSGPGGGFLGGAATAGAGLLIALCLYLVPRFEPLFPGIYVPEVSALGRTFGGYRVWDARVFSWLSLPPGDVVRTGQALCWTLQGEKVRDAELLDVDADVDYVSARTGRMAHQPTPEIYDEATGEPLTSESATPAGPFYRRRCLRLAPQVMPGQPVQVRIVAYYQSATGLYSVPVRLPNIYFPETAAALFAAMPHDRAPTPEEPDAVAGPRPRRLSLPGGDEGGDGAAGLLRDILEPAPRAAPAGRVEARVSADVAAEIERYRASRGLRSAAAAVRELIGRGLAADARDDLGPFDCALRP